MLADSMHKIVTRLSEIKELQQFVNYDEIHCEHVSGISLSRSIIS